MIGISVGVGFSGFEFIFLMFSSFGNWGYTYRAHRKYDGTNKDAIDILNERYARGEINAGSVFPVKIRYRQRHRNEWRRIHLE